MTNDDISRRNFVTRAAVAGAVLTAGRAAPQSVSDAADDVPVSVRPLRAAPVGMVQPFPLSAVRLLPGRYADAAELNRKYPSRGKIYRSGPPDSCGTWIWSRSIV